MTEFEFNEQNALQDQSNREIIQFIRKKSGRRVGVMWASNNGNGKVIIGFSLCDGKDKFDRKRGLQIAEIRAERYSHREIYKFIHYNEKKRDIIRNFGQTDNAPIALIPLSIRPQIERFLIRCNSRFKNASLPRWAEKMLASISPRKKET